MGIISNFKYNRGLRELQKEYDNSKKPAVVCKLSDAKSIGIIYDATQPENFEKIKKFTDELKINTPEIVALGFVDKKELSDSHIKPQGFLFFCRKDINWHYKPTEDNVINFENKNFDILIDLSNGDTLPLKYIVVGSKAKFKIGKFSEKGYNFFDVTLDINPESSKDLSYFIEQVKIYLNMIKTK